MVDIYSIDKRTNKQVAILILGAIFAQTVGLLKAFGFDLAQVPVFGISILNVLLSIGVLWILWGLHKHQIGV